MKQTQLKTSLKNKATKKPITPDFISAGIAKVGIEEKIEKGYIAIGSPMGEINFHQVKQIAIYFVIFIAMNLGTMGLQQLTGANWSEFEWLKQGVIFLLTIIVKKLGQDSSNIFIKK